MCLSQDAAVLSCSQVLSNEVYPGETCTSVKKRCWSFRPEGTIRTCTSSAYVQFYISVTPAVLRCTLLMLRIDVEPDLNSECVSWNVFEYRTAVALRDSGPTDAFLSGWNLTPRRCDILPTYYCILQLHSYHRLLCN